MFADFRKYSAGSVGFRRMPQQVHMLMPNMPLKYVKSGSCGLCMASRHLQHARRTQDLFKHCVKSIQLRLQLCVH